MPGLWLQNLQDSLNIHKQLIHNIAHLLYSKVKFWTSLCDLIQDKQLSGLRPLS